MEWFQLETEYPCDLCGRHARCYRGETNRENTDNTKISFICPEAYRGSPPHMTLIKYFLQSLCYDVRREIMIYYYQLNPPCLESKLKIIKKREAYLDYDFSSLTVKQLKVLIDTYCPEYKYTTATRKSALQDMLKMKKLLKQREWKNNYYIDL